MARIRTVKPEFFRHEGLQDLEIANPGASCMLVFEGLWGHCDAQGVFEYRPRQLKLDILPFLPFDMETTLGLLEEAGFVQVFENDGKRYGFISSFTEHQRLSGKEAGESGVKHPQFSVEATGKQRGSTREHPDAQEKEREKEREWSKGKEGKGNAPAPEISKHLEIVPHSGQFQKPDIEEVKAFASIHLADLPPEQCEKFWFHYDSQGWRVGSVPMDSWQSSLSKWRLGWLEERKRPGRTGSKPSVMEQREEALRIANA